MFVLVFSALCIAGVPMHRFPNADKFPQRLKAWVNLVGGKLETAVDYAYYQTKLVCDIHFTARDRNRNNRLNALAVPSLHLHGTSARDPDISLVSQPSNLHATNTGTSAREPDISIVSQPSHLHATNTGTSAREPDISIVSQPSDLHATNTATIHGTAAASAVMMDHSYSEASRYSRKTFRMGGGGAQLGEIENCDAGDLNMCVDLIPRTPVGLPRNKQELDAHCQAYQTGMVCMDAWIKRCLPTDGQKLLQQQIGGARALMRFLCTNDTALRREFLKEPTCWGRVSPDWTRCVDELQVAVRENTDRAQQLTYFNRNAELCCARDDFIQCVANAGRSCSIAASTLLRRMAWVLAQDIAACNQQPRAYCAAPPPPITAPLLTAIYGFLFYPPRL